MTEEQIKRKLKLLCWQYVGLCLNAWDLAKNSIRPGVSGDEEFMDEMDAYLYDMSLEVGEELEEAVDLLVAGKVSKLKEEDGK